jgi:hypothetical protein
MSPEMRETIIKRRVCANMSYMLVRYVYERELYIEEIYDRRDEVFTLGTPLCKELWYYGGMELYDKLNAMTDETLIAMVLNGGKE